MHNISLSKHVAILIDAENIQHFDHWEEILKFSEYYGEISICRAYGDWNLQNLSPYCEKVDALKIDRIQVDQIGKNAADHRLLIEAGEILGASFAGNPIDVFVIVSGDGDFASGCKYLQEGCLVIGIGRKENTANAMPLCCDEYYYLEDLDSELQKLKQRFRISPKDVREYFKYLFFAYHQLTTQKYGWVTFNQLESKIRDYVPNYDTKFGTYSLDEWLENYQRTFEIDGQRIQRIDTTCLDLLVTAYYKTRQPDGLAHIGQLGKELRNLTADYESQFSGKKLSKWLRTYPNIFEVDEHHVRVLSKTIEY